VVVSSRHNFYAAGTADNYFAGNTGFGVVNPAQKIDVVGSGLFRAATNQDGVLISGRAGGTGSFNAILTPATLSTNRTLTLPDTSGTIAIDGGRSTGLLRPPAGSATADTAPLKFVAGINMTTPEAGALEYDGTFMYATPTTTEGRGAIDVRRTFRLAANGANIGPTIADFLGANSALSLAASSVYEFDAWFYFTKNTAGTVTWSLASSANVNAMYASYIANAIAGMGTGGVLQSYASTRGLSTLSYAATASIANNTTHNYRFTGVVFTSAAANFRLRITQSAGTVTPLAGSYITFNRVSSTTGSFVA
jgi:hypothetical protein